MIEEYHFFLIVHYFHSCAWVRLFLSLVHYFNLYSIALFTHNFFLWIFRIFFSLVQYFNFLGHTFTILNRLLFSLSWFIFSYHSFHMFEFFLLLIRIFRSLDRLHSTIFLTRSLFSVTHSLVFTIFTIFICILIHSFHLYTRSLSFDAGVFFSPW